MCSIVTIILITIKYDSAKKKKKFVSFNYQVVYMLSEIQICKM